MMELQAYPRTGALLRELCGWGQDQPELPLQLIANMYKGVLRHPLQVLGGLVELTNSGQVSYFDIFRTYSVLRFNLVYDYKKLEALEEQAVPLRVAMAHAPQAALTPQMQALLADAAQRWNSVWPAVLLHRFTWPNQQLETLLPMFEFMLETNVNVARTLIIQAREEVRANV